MKARKNAGKFMNNKSQLLTPVDVLSCLISLCKCFAAIFFNLICLDVKHPRLDCDIKT